MFNSLFVKLFVFLLIAGIVFSFMGGMVSIFGTFAIIAYSGAGLTFLAWVFDKFFLGGGGNGE